MVEVVVSIVAKIAEYFVAPIRRPFSYLYNYKSNFGNLKKEVEKLVDARERVQHLVGDAKRKGEEIEQDVENWLTRVNGIIDDGKKIIEDEEREKQQCFKVLCPNLKSRYQLSKKALMEVKVVTKLLEEAGKFDKVSYRTIPEEIWLASNKGYVAFESRMSALKDMLTTLSNPSVNMIGVYGMGGVGKTTLVKEVARCAKKEKLFDEVVFAVVSQTPAIEKIQGEIADQLGLEFFEESKTGRARRLYARLKKVKKILVIFDDIWTSLDLETVGIPLGDHMGCKVLLTSRSRDVLSSEMDSQNNFFIGVLQEKESWSLFKKMTGDYIENFNLQTVAIDIVKECAGLPIAIVAVARALRKKSLFEWKNALRQLRRPSFRSFSRMQAVVYSTIELSYNHLDDEELKPIFLLIGYTYITCIVDLFKYGIGLGLFQCIHTMEEARDRAYTLVHKLKASCLLLDGHTNEEFSMHDVVRDVAISIASRDHHVFTITKEVVLREWPDKNTLKSCTAISLEDVDIGELPEGLECSKLKLCCISSSCPFLKIPDNFCEGVTELRVLDFTGLNLTLPSSLRLLVNLRTLCLDSCILGDITIIGDLKKLEILSFFGSDIEQLPGELGQLTQLRLLDLSHCSNLKVIPPNIISNLSRLEELYMGNSFVEWEVEGVSSVRSNVSLDELKHLSNLTTLEVQIQDPKTLPEGLFSRKLERYKIFIGDNWDWSGNDETSRTLKLKLNTSSCLKDEVIMQLKEIEDLYLDELQGVKNVLYELHGEGFPQLKNLHAQNNPCLLFIVDSMEWVAFDAFPLLETLFLCNLINLEKIYHGQLTTMSFCKLRIIKVEKCDQLKNIFSFSIARSLSQLQKIEVTECKNMNEIFAIRREDNVDRNKVIDKIEFGQLRFLTLKSLPKLSSFCFEVKMSQISPKRQNLLTIDAWSNEVVLEEKLDTPVPFFNENVKFPNLEALELSAINCEKIWQNQLPAMSCIQNLTRLIVQDCGNLKYLFSSSIVRSFVQLQHLEICKCKVLEEIIVIEELREEDRNDLMFPQLTYLKMKDLEKLTRFYSGSCIEFPSLRQLQIEQCPELKAFILKNISTDMTRGSEVQKMSSIEIHHSGIQPFFNEKVAIPSLEEMVISHVDNLEIIWNNQLPEDSFCKLKLLKVESCDKLLTVFPSNILGRFLRLESLTITDCGSVEEIFELQDLNFEEMYSTAVAQLRELYIHGLPRLKHVWNMDNKGILSFQELHFVRVSRCKCLRNLFPAYIARSLLQLEELEMIICGVEEIVAKGGAKGAASFFFPRVTSLNLESLPELRCFYPGVHTSEWPALKKLNVFNCEKFKIFASEFISFHETSEDDLLDIPVQQPLFLVEKIIPNLEELSFNRKDITKIWHGQFPEDLFRKLKVLEVQCFHDESSEFPFGFLQKFPYLETLVISCSGLLELFPSEILVGDEKYAETPTWIRNLRLQFLTNLKHIWKQDCRMDSILQKLETLELSCCDTLINLGPSSASFQNLTVLTIFNCKGLINIVTSSTARSLVQLTIMTVIKCNMMTEIVASRGSKTEDVITFSKLKSLFLRCLPSLTSFCLRSYSFEFPSLEDVLIEQCPNLNIFSPGVVSTPKLQKVWLTGDLDESHWVGDLNNTIRRICVGNEHPEF